jgi:hypothetical protein
MAEAVRRLLSSFNRFPRESIIFSAESPAPLYAAYSGGRSSSSVLHFKWLRRLAP